MPQWADAGTMDAWHALAGQVAAALRVAGLPVIRCGYGRGGPVGGECGAVVEVDPVDDGAGGVFVSWQVGEELARPVRAALLAGRVDDPAITHFGRTVSIMIDAVARLLIDHGFAVEDAARVNDLRALQIHVQPARRHIP
jgi:hypothetical protein